MENRPFEDASPSKNGDFPASHVSLLEGIPESMRLQSIPVQIPFVQFPGPLPGNWNLKAFFLRLQTMDGVIIDIDY